MVFIDLDSLEKVVGPGKGRSFYRAWRPFIFQTMNFSIVNFIWSPIIPVIVDNVLRYVAIASTKAILLNRHPDRLLLAHGERVGCHLWIHLIGLPLRLFILMYPIVLIHKVVHCVFLTPSSGVIFTLSFLSLERLVAVENLDVLVLMVIF